MRVISSIEEMTAFSESFRKENPPKKIGFVATMGALHAGHLSLIQKAREAADLVVVSIFVNPLQFDQKEDFEKYPREQAQDQKLLEREGVDILFAPLAQDVFSDKKPRLKLSVPDLEGSLCAPFRPGHFEGVLFIVYFLLLWVRPHFSVFGLKDYQQYLYVKIMAEELHIPTKILSAPTVRDQNGLALSSRNQRLSSKAREEAVILYKTLKTCEEEWEKGSSVESLRSLLHKELKNQDLEYADIYSPDDLSPLKGDQKPEKALFAVAAWFEGVRLIDNLLVRGGHIN